MAKPCPVVRWSVAPGPRGPTSGDGGSLTTRIRCVRFALTMREPPEMPMSGAPTDNKNAHSVILALYLHDRVMLAR